MTNKKSKLEALNTQEERNDSAHNLTQLHHRIYQRISRMNAAQGFKTLIESGIYTENGNLTKHYGG